MDDSSQMITRLQRELQVNNSRSKNRNNNNLGMPQQNLTEHILPTKASRIFASNETESPSPVKKLTSNNIPGGYLSNSFYQDSNGGTPYSQYQRNQSNIHQKTPIIIGDNSHLTSSSMSQSALFSSPQPQFIQNKTTTSDSPLPSAMNRPIFVDKQHNYQHNMNRNTTTVLQQITPGDSQYSSYMARKEQVKEVFISKDELYKRVSHKFRQLLRLKERRINSNHNQSSAKIQQWAKAEQEISQLLDKVRHNFNLQKINMSKNEQQKEELVRSRSQITGFLVSNSASSRSKERKVWKSQVPGVSRRKDTISNHRQSTNMLIKENLITQNSHHDEESDCNVAEDDEFENVRQALLSQQQSEAQLEQKEIKISESQALIVQHQELIESQLHWVLDIIKNIKEEHYQSLQSNDDSKSRSEDESLFGEMKSLYQCVKELEDRYYETTMAWEKELRDLISQNKLKQERICLLDSSLQEATHSRNEYRHKLDAFQKDLQFLTHSLNVYGYLQQSEEEPQLTVQSIKNLFDENAKLKVDMERILNTVQSSREDLNRVSASSKSAVQGIPQLLSHQYKLAKDVYEQQTADMQRSFDQRMQEMQLELQRGRTRMIEMIDEKTRFEGEIGRLRTDKREARGEVETARKRITELEGMLVEGRQRQMHVSMGVETKNVAISEVTQRNDILSESIDKMRNELLNCRRNLSQVEAEKFDLEKEVLKLRRDVKTYEQHISLLNEEKEHLIQMLELKNSILSSFQYSDKDQGKPSVLQPREIFLAMQRMSLFMLNRTQDDSKFQKIHGAVDETTKAIVRSVFNEQSARMVDQYEKKIDQQKSDIADLTKELIESYQSIIMLNEQISRQGKISSSIRDEVDRMNQSNSYSHQLEGIYQMAQELILEEPLQSIQQKNQKYQEKVFVLMNRLDNIKSFESNQLSMNQFIEQVPTKPKRKLSASPRPERHPRTPGRDAYSVLDELRNQNETLKVKLDLTLAELEQTKSQLKDHDRLKKIVEQLSVSNSALQRGPIGLDSNFRLHKSSNSELKEVIRRLDSELQRQKSHNALNLEQDELRLRIETDRFFKGQEDDESDFGKRKRRQARSQSGNRDKGMPSTPMQEQSPLSIMQQKQIQELQEQIRQKDEDVKAMLELQCIVIEDLLIKQRFNPPMQSKTPASMSGGDISPIIMGARSREISCESPDLRMIQPIYQGTPDFEEQVTKDNKPKRSVSSLSAKKTLIAPRNYNQIITPGPGFSRK